MKLRPITYMTWAKGYLDDPSVYNLGNSGIRGIVTDEDLRPLLEGLSFFGHNEDGYPRLKEAIGVRYGVDPAGILVSEGTSLANFLVLSAWLRPGDCVLLEEPYYEPLAAVLEATGARVRTVAVDDGRGHEALLDALRSNRGTRIRAAVITNPHNPTGRRVDETLIDSLAEECERQGALLVIDEVYREIFFEDPPGCAARGRPNTVSTASLTKVFGLNALRCGWAIGPRTLIERAMRLHDNLGVVHPFITEAVGAEVIGRPGLMDSWRRRVAARVATNRAALASFLEGRTGLRGGMPAHGILSFTTLEHPERFGGVDGLWERSRAEARVVFVPGRFFQRPDCLRIGVGGDPEVVRGGLAAFASFLDRNA